MKSVPLLFVAVFALVSLCNAQTLKNSLLGIPIRGKVILPNGSPARGAAVEVIACADDRTRFARRVETNETGNFLILSFSTECSNYAFKASFTREMWLPTGLDAFYLQPNGTTPSIHLKPGIIPEPVLIHLGDQGGEIELRVLDEATGSYLKAGVSLTRTTATHPNISIVSFATDPNSSNGGRLLPAGKYKVEVGRYFCADKQIWLVKPIKRDFSVAVGKREQVIVSLNTKLVKAKPSYDNLNTSSCTP